MRVYTSTPAGDVSALAPGRDLVVHVPEAQGLELAEGVGARDHLAVAERPRVDALARAALDGWRTAHDAALTIDGVCWPFIAELELFRGLFVPAIADAAGVQRALATYEADSVVLMDRDPRTEAIVRAAAARRRVPVQAGGGLPSRPERRPARQPLPRRARRVAADAVLRVGVPSLVRDGSVVVMGYWPLMPLLDRMLADRRARPALVLQSRPTGPARSLRIAARGGWLGAPGPAARRRARRRAETAAAAAAVARLEVGGFELGGWFHRRAVEIVRRRAERGIADAAMLRRAFGSGRVRRVVVPFDHTPVGRLLVTLAHEASIPTLVVQHGAYFLPSELTDMQVGREVAVWSPALVPAPILARDPHVVGYPLGHARPATRARGPAGPARVLVLPQPYDPTTCVVDSRIVMRHYSAAIEAARATLGDARVALRPHPADDLEAVAELQRRYGDLEVDRRPDILQVLRDADLCIAGCSTATLQAALVGTPVIVLNATGYEWRPPLGADTAVPIARGFEDLSRWLERWAGGAVLPGGKDLLDALGVDGGDAAGRLLGIVDVRGSTARRENTPLTTVSRTEP